MFVVASGSRDVGREAHDFSDSCSSCHRDLADPRDLVASPHLLCLECHRDRASRSHPSGVHTDSEMPDGFPTYRGKIVCTTCHIAHRTQDLANHEQRWMDFNPQYLRSASTGKQFCIECHRNGFARGSADSHASSSQWAHNNPRERAKMATPTRTSKDCMSCHDGSIAGDVPIQLGTMSPGYGTGIGMSHPIGLSYSTAQRSKPRELRHAATLDPRIQLFNGTIQCETCHDAFADNQDMLVMENDGSRLCFGCHDL